MNETVDRLNKIYDNSCLYFFTKERVQLKPDDIIDLLRAENAARWLLNIGVLENLPKMNNGKALPIVQACWCVIEGKIFDHACYYRMIISFAHRHGWKGYED